MRRWILICYESDEVSEARYDDDNVKSCHSAYTFLSFGNLTKLQFGCKHCYG